MPGRIGWNLQPYWDKLRSSLWFIPSLCMMLAVVLALAFVSLDRMVGPYSLDIGLPLLFGAGAAGSRGMLSSIATSMITLAGVAFSITVVVLSLASSQYSPRILRNFMRDRANQSVLGILVSIYVYCLIVLRAIRGGDEGAFVPTFAVLLAILLALAGIASFIFFIHHIAYSIQAESIIKSAADETLHTIDRLFPDELPESQRDEQAAIESHPHLLDELVSRQWQSVRARKPGYLQTVDYDGLVTIARESHLVIHVHVEVGEFIIEGAILAQWTSCDELSDELTDGNQGDEDTLCDIERRFDIGRTRTMLQDASFGVQQIVDIALRALSSGINDTTTAVTCVHYLCTLISHLATKQFPVPYELCEGRLLVIKQVPTFEKMSAAAFDNLRQNAHNNLPTLAALLKGIEIIQSRTGDDSRRRALADRYAATAALARQIGYQPH